MSVIAEYTVSADDFVLGRATPAEMQVDLERILMDDQTLFPYFWADGDRYDRFEAALRDTGAISDVTLLDGTCDRNLYRGVCDPAADTFAGGIVEHDVLLLYASGDDEAWSFQMRFPDTRDLSDFQTFVVDRAGVSLRLEHIYNPVDRAPGIESKLTPRQRETLLTAHEEGYFDIPRKITLVDLAGQLGVSDQAVSERLRRGESKLIQSQLLGENGADD